MYKYDFIAVGDIVTDAFIKLRQADVHKHVNEADRELCMPFATKIPFDSVVVVPAVGNSANAAVAASRLGLSGAYVTNQGDDEIGAGNLKVLKEEKVSTDFVKVHRGIPSNYHYVLLFNADRTILVKHEVYPYALPDIGEPKWIYLTSLGETSFDFHNEIAGYLKKHPSVNLAFQPGTFQIRMGREKLASVYKRSKIFFSNVEEAQTILETSNRDLTELLKKIAELGPKIVCLTDGTAGAYAFDSENNQIWQMPIYPDLAPPTDRTGAGDAYSSTVTAALALGQTLSEALMWASINSMSVTQYIGAREGLLSQEKIKEYLAKAPADYKPRLV